MPWLRHFALSLLFVATLFGPANTATCALASAALGSMTGPGLAAGGLAASQGGRVLSQMGDDVASGLSRAVAAGGGARLISLPAWRRVAVNMEHILPRHTPGGQLSAGRTVFPAVMNERGISRAIRAAYESARKVGVQGTDRVLLQGRGGGLTIEMWFNRVTNTIETAYPVTP